MARLLTTGFEHNSLTAGVEPGLSANAGTTSISSTTKRSGGYALRCNPTNGSASVKFTVTAQTTGRVYHTRVYLQVTTTPNKNIAIMGFGRNSDNAGVGIALNTDLTLTLFNLATRSAIGSNSPALATGGFYRIEVSMDWNTNAVSAYVDGVAFVNGGSATSIEYDTIWLGVGDYSTGAVGQGSSTTNVFFDDIALNDSSGSSQTGLPGSGKIIKLKPSAAGDANTFGTQTGGTAGAGNNFTRVSENTPDNATTFNGSSTLNQEDLFNVDDSGIGASDTVNVVHVGFRFRNSTADATAGIKVEIEKTGSGTKTQSSEIKPNSTTWKTNATANPTNHPITLYKDPDGTNPWTQTTLDSMQIGYKLTTGPGTAGRRIDVSAVWAYVDYTPASTFIKTINALAKASVKTINNLAISSVKSKNGLT